MPDQLEYIVKDALMMCDKGAAPGMFTPTFNTTVKVSGCLVSTKADKIPMVNIPTFGACACRGGSPCTAIPIEWLDTYKAKVKGQETILYKSKLPCGNGGKIEFLTSGQVPLPDDVYDELLEEHGEEEGGLSWWDAAELIPFAGGVIGTVRSAAKGDLLGVGLSLASVALDVGGLFTFGGGNAASAAVKGGKLARVGVKAANAMTKAGKAMRLSGKAAKAFASAAAKSVDNIALKTGKICVFACFPAGTPISVKDGFKNVEDIKVGDWVWAYNEQTGESDLKPVVNTVQNEVDTTIKITLEDETIETTVEHPFYTRGGWKDAADLTTEDEVKTKRGAWSYIKKLNFNYQKKKVYNFEVSDWHTYFVGVWAWLVHNAAKCVSATVKKVGNNTYDLALKFKGGWTKQQKAEAIKKAKALSKANTKVVKKPIRKSGTRKTFTKKGGKVKKGQDVDHTIELQLGGADNFSNMKPLDLSVNRSFGSQIRNATKNLPAGTKIRNVKID